MAPIRPLSEIILTGKLRILEPKNYGPGFYPHLNVTGSLSFTDMSNTDNAQPAANPEASTSHVENADTNMPDATAPATAMTAAEIIPRAVPAGSQPRVYLNNKVVPHVLEAVKNVSLNQPDKPIKWLGEFFMARSKEVEGD